MLIVLFIIDIVLIILGALIEHCAYHTVLETTGMVLAIIGVIAIVIIIYTAYDSCYDFVRIKTDDAKIQMYTEENNIDKVIELKEDKIEKEASKWWLYFGKIEEN